MSRMGEKRVGISGNGLKWIAIVSMFIDHVGAFLLAPHMNSSVGKEGELIRLLWWNLSQEEIVLIYALLREIGRIAFPIFCFQLVQGARYTTDRKRYVLRMFIFGVLSEIPFDLCHGNQLFDWQYQNVFFTLALGLLAIYWMDYWKERYFVSFGGLAVVGALAWFGHVDYGYAGIVLIALLWVFRMDERWRTALGAVWLVLGIGLAEAAGVFAFLPIHFYNGEKGKGNKYFFYCFYPGHLLLLFLLRQLW